MEEHEAHETHKKKNSGLALAGLIISIVGLLLSAIPIINNFAMVLAIVALIFGVIALFQTKKGKKKGRTKAIVTIILAVLTGIIVLASQYMYSQALNKVGDSLNKATKSIDDSADRSSGKDTAGLLKTDVNVVLGTFTSTTDQYGISTTSLPVTVTNKNKDKKSYSIEIEAVDATGKRIADDTVSANDLNSNQSQDFQAFQYVDPSQLSAVKTATFKIVTVSQF